MYLNQSAHGITTVKGTLRSAQYIDTFYIRIIEIESRFIYIRYIVDVKSHGRRIDA